MSLTAETRTVDVKHYYPNTVAPSKEFQTIAELENSEYNEFWAKLWRLMANTFVYDIDLVGASRWEDMLNIIPPKGSSLKERKKKILEKINSSLPYTERSFQNMLDGIYGVGAVTVFVDYDKYALYLDVDYGTVFKQSGLRKYARVIVPANLDILITNTKYVSGKVYVGGMLNKSTTTVIKPNETWEAGQLNMAQGHGGYIKMFRRMGVS